jgi:hypothetical protein
MVFQSQRADGSAVGAARRTGWIERLKDYQPGDPAFGWPALFLLSISLSFLYLALFVLPHTPRLTRGDQYINFDNARRMVQGQSLYRTIFQYTLPGTEWLYYILIRLFGSNLAVLQATQVVTGALTVWLGLGLAAPVLRGWKALLPPLLFLAFALRFTLDATHHKFSVLLIYAATAVLIRKRDRPRLAVAGLLCGMAASFTQTRALMLAAFALFVLWEGLTERRDTRRLLADQLCLIAPFVVVLGLVCGYMIAEVGLARFIYLVIKFPLEYYRKDPEANTWACFLRDYPSPSVTPTGFAAWIGIKLLVPFVYVPAAVHLWRRAAAGKTADRRALVLLIMVGVSLYATIAYAPLATRLYEIALPAFIVLVWWVDTSPARPLNVVALGLAAAMLVAVPIRTQTKSYCYVTTPAGVIADIYPESCQVYGWLAGHVHPGDYFFSPYDPTINVLLDTRDPVPVPYIINDGYLRKRQVTRALERLELHQPHLIAGYMEPEDYDDSGDRLYPFGEFLRKYYRLRKTFPNNFQVWERRSVSPSLPGKPNR